jgi:hypothetical protein
MDDDSIRIDPPLYLSHTKISCWRCGAKMPALALVAPNVAEADGEICILSEIEELPKAVLHFVRNRFPSFTLRYSKTAGSPYYANTCLRCGVISGDFYLHSEPGAPFFPTTKAEAEQLTLEPVPLAGPITVRAGVGIGAGDLILEHARKPTLTQPALTRAGKASRR